MVIISILGTHAIRTYPTAYVILDRVRRAKAAHSLRTIAVAHAQFITDFGRAITFAEMQNISENDSCRANNFAAFLAKYGYIEGGSVWAWELASEVKAYKRDDPNTLPIEIDNQSNGTIHPHFT
jgi:hypothetical protein